MNIFNNASVLVTGATGAVGPRIVSALMEAGYGVRTLSIDAPPTGVWPAGVDVRSDDASNYADKREAKCFRVNLLQETI